MILTIFLAIVFCVAIVIIAHRMRTIANADHIVVLKDRLMWSRAISVGFIMRALIP